MANRTPSVASGRRRRNTPLKAVHAVRPRLYAISSHEHQSVHGCIDFGDVQQVLGKIAVGSIGKLG